jgi:hypothetical protein
LWKIFLLPRRSRSLQYLINAYRNVASDSEIGVDKKNFKNNFSKKLFVALKVHHNTLQASCKVVRLKNYSPGGVAPKRVVASPDGDASWDGRGLGTVGFDRTGGCVAFQYA